MSQNGCCCDWSKLSDDLTVEILCRLPEKPLIQFKCVSKAWYFMISDVCAPRKSPPASSAPLSGFLYRWTTLDHLWWTTPLESTLDATEYYLDFIPPDDNYGCRAGFVQSFSALLPFPPTGRDVLGCSNGLFLVVNRSASRANRSAPQAQQYFVCNPATKQCVAIPVNQAHMDDLYAALAFDPLGCPPNYKIARIARSAWNASVNSPPVVDVFSSVTGQWVNHQVPLEPELYGFKWIRQSVYLDGVLYFISCALYLLCFHLKSEAQNLNARAIKLPLKDGEAALLDLGYIGVSKGCFYYSTRVKTKVLVWSLDFGCSKDGQWVLKHSISIDDLSLHHHNSLNLKHECLSYWLRLYSIHPTSEVIYLGTPRMIFTYLPKTNQLEVLCTMKDRRLITYGEKYLFPYSRSLIVLDDFTPRN